MADPLHSHTTKNRTGEDVPRTPRCTCTGDQLDSVGCDCGQKERPPSEPAATVAHGDGPGTVALAFEDFPWEDGVGADYLIATMTLGGVPFHVEAIAVEQTADGLNVALRADQVARVEELETSSDCAFRTVPARGRQWVVVATPFGA